MAKLLTSQQMQTADRRTIEELGLPGVVLMENAGHGVVAVLKKVQPDWQDKKIFILCGRGNNGGDGLVIARCLLQEGGKVHVTLLAQGSDLKGDAALNYHVYRKLGGALNECITEEDWSDLTGRLQHADLLVDAIFGTGLSKPVTGRLASLFERINGMCVPVMAVDIPSGVGADTGEVLAVAMRADWTVTFAAEKIGHRQYPGAGYCGQLTVVPIGIPSYYIDHSDHKVSRNLPTDLAIPGRARQSHKGRYGHLLLVAGSVGKAGAAILAAKGALRMGTGLVTVATSRGTQPQVAAQLLEAMTWPLAGDDMVAAAAIDELVNHAEKWSAWAIGPGLGVSATVRSLVYSLLCSRDEPMVLDADALNVLLEAMHSFPLWTRQRNSPVILTPHPGEMARLLSITVAEVQKNRLAIAMQKAVEWHVWLVLKGAATVIASPDGWAWINETGNPGMAAGGSGDLLTGMLAGLLAQGWEVETAVRFAVWAHGEAGDRAVAKQSGEAGLLASDLLPFLPVLLAQAQAWGEAQ